jgi:hypothetical protein
MLYGAKEYCQILLSLFLKKGRSIIALQQHLKDQPDMKTMANKKNTAGLAG